MVYYIVIGTVFVFHIQINWNFIFMAIAFSAAIHRPLLTIYQQHRNFKGLVYVGVLLIQIRFICVLACFIVKLIRWLNLTHKTHTFNANAMPMQWQWQIVGEFTYSSKSVTI